MAASPVGSRLIVHQNLFKRFLPIPSGSLANTGSIVAGGAASDRLARSRLGWAAQARPAAAATEVDLRGPVRINEGWLAEAGPDQD
jgi:hypothetical protein